MLKVLLPAVLFLNFFCKTVQTPSDWDNVQYIFESGPVSPKYQYDYTIQINKNLEGTLLYSYGAERDKSLSYHFTISKENAEMISKYISAMKLMSDAIPELPEDKRPIGGSLQKVRIVEDITDPNADRPPKVYETPYFPSEEYKTDLTKMYNYILSLVPKSYFDDASSKREEYINSN